MANIWKLVDSNGNLVKYHGIWCSGMTTSETGSAQFSVPENETDNAIVYRLIMFDQDDPSCSGETKVTVKACESGQGCGCLDVEPSVQLVNFFWNDWTGEVTKRVDFRDVDGDCLSSISSQSTTHFGVSVVSTRVGKYITISPKYDNTGNTTFNDDVIVTCSINSDPPRTCTKTIQVTQEAQNGGGNCTCNSIPSYLPTSHTFDADYSYSDYAKTSAVNPSRCTNISATVSYAGGSGSWLNFYWGEYDATTGQWIKGGTNVSLNSNGYTNIIFWPLKPYTGTSPRIGYIDFTVGSEPCTSMRFTVTQNAPGTQGCDCSNANVGTITPVEIEAKPNESDYWASFTANSTVCSDVSNFSVERADGGYFVNVGSVTVTHTGSTYKLSGGILENTTTEERKEKLKLLVNGDSTCTNIFEITQKGKANCNCGNVTGILNISATPTSGVLLGRFTGGTECVPSDFKVVKYYDENIVDISNVVINGSNGSFSVYANITKQNTNVNGRTQQLLVQKVSDGQMCGGPFLIEQQGTEPKCIVELSVSKGNESDCGVNFKVKEKCSEIDNYDVIEWGWSTNNVPNFNNGQAFGAISAIGEGGVTQDANVQETTLTNYHIWWRNRTVPSVSGTTTVQLKKCGQGQYDVVLLANNFLSSGEVGTINWGDGNVSSFQATASSVRHTYADGVDEHTVLVERSSPSRANLKYQQFTLSRTVTSATICDCDALPTLTGNYVFRWYDADTINIDVNTNGCGNMYVRNGDPSATWCNAEFINDGKTLSISIDKSPGEMLRHTILFYGIKAGTAQDPTSSKYECNWLYVGQGGVVECDELRRKINGESVYLQYNDTTTTMLDYVKCINIKDIEPSDITYDPYDGDKWSWDDYQQYGTNWITGCTWLPNGGLKINTTLNSSSFPTTVARGATIAIKLITDNQTTCANIRVIQYCEHCMGD